MLRIPVQSPATSMLRIPVQPHASSPSTSTSPRWIAVAEVMRPHGVVGELRLRVYSGDPALLLRRPNVRLKKKEGDITDVRIKSARPNDKALLVFLEGVPDRNAAEQLRGAELLVERGDLGPLEEGEFYACDVEGARAELVSGDFVGTVTGLGTYPTCDVLLIDREGKRLEVPILPQFVESVDTANALVRLVTLEGLE